MKYRMRKNISVNEDGHIMRAISENGLDTMIADTYDAGSHTEVDIKTRTKIFNSGDTKKKMSTRRSFDNSKNFKKREMTNIGIVVDQGTTIDTSKASDGEYKNSKCVNLSGQELKSAKVSRAMRMYMNKFGIK